MFLKLNVGIDFMIRRINKGTAASAAVFQFHLISRSRPFFCRCGRSDKQPFCDGNHKDTGIEPMRFTVEESGMFNLCGCKATDDEPFCDGTHNML